MALEFRDILICESERPLAADAVRLDSSPPDELPDTFVGYAQKFCDFRRGHPFHRLFVLSFSHVS